MVKASKSRSALAGCVLAAIGLFANTGACAAADPAAVVAITARLNPGLAALQAGRHDEAVRLLTAELARSSADPLALSLISYYRGVAQARAGHTTAAIADLNQALYRKQLPADLAQQAQVERARAYAAIGQTPANSADLPSRDVAKGAPGAESRESRQLAAAWEPAVTLHHEPETTSLAETSALEPVSQPQTPKLIAPPSAAPIGFNADPTVGVVDAAPPGLGQLLSGLFAAPTAAPAAANTTPPAPAADLGWSSQFERDAQAADLAAASASGVVLRLAAVRDLTAARAVVDRLTTTHQTLLGARKPRISPITLGNMGDFYEVTLGPFAASTSPETLCAGFTQAGLDCLPVQR